MNLSSQSDNHMRSSVNSQSTAQLSKRRRILYTALSELLYEPDALKAMVLWETKFMQQPQLPLRYFAEDLAKEFQQLDAKQVLKAFARSLAVKDPSKWLPDPDAKLNTYRKKMPGGLDNRPNSIELEAFEMLGKKLLNSLHPERARSIRRFVITQLENLDIDGTFKTQITHWLGHQSQSLKKPDCQIRELRQIISIIYVGMCEYIGPVEADRVLAESVRQLRQNGGEPYWDTFAALL